MASFKELSKGNWQVSFYCKDYLGKNKKYKKSGFKTKKEAKEYSDEFINKLNGSSDVYFFTVIDEYLDYCKDKIKKQTLKSRETLIKKIKEIAINVPINQLDHKYFFHLFEKLNDKKGMRRLIKSYISLTLDYCKINYNLKTNPCREYKLPKLKEDNINNDFNETDKIWTIEDFNEFLEIVDTMKEDTKIKYKALFVLLYFTGMRIGEALALTKKDIDLKNKVVYVTKTRIYTNEDNSPKTKSSRRKIELDDYTVEILNDYISCLPKINNFRLFNTYETVKSNFKLLLNKSNLKPISLHGFRHSHASLLINLGVNIVDISKRLGHSNPAMTLKIYSHFYKTENSIVLDKLNKKLKK